MISLIKKTLKDIKDKVYLNDRGLYEPQIHALTNPYKSCFDHCTSQFLQNVSIKFKPITPEVVTNTLNSKYYIDWVKNNLGLNIYNTYKSNVSVLWDLQLKFINDNLSKIGKKAYFNNNTKLSDIRKGLKDNSIIINTKPWYNGKQLGHIMLVEGYYSSNFWLDDPFGEYDFNSDRYLNHENGNNLSCTESQLQKIRGSLSICLCY